MLTWKQLREAFLSLDSPNRTLDLPDYKGFSAIGLSQQRTILKSFLDRVLIEQNNLDQVALDNKNYNIECYSDHFKKESDELQNIKEQKSFVAAELASL